MSVPPREHTHRRRAETDGRATDVLSLGRVCRAGDRRVVPWARARGDGGAAPEGGARVRVHETNHDSRRLPTSSLVSTSSCGSSALRRPVPLRSARSGGSRVPRVGGRGASCPGVPPQQHGPQGDRAATGRGPWRIPRIGGPNLAHRPRIRVACRRDGSRRALSDFTSPRHPDEGRSRRRHRRTTRRAVRRAHPARSRLRSAAVLRAYEYRCAVCAYDGQVGKISVGIEAAHLKWFSHGGPEGREQPLPLFVLAVWRAGLAARRRRSAAPRRPPPRPARRAGRIRSDHGSPCPDVDGTCAQHGLHRREVRDLR